MEASGQIHFSTPFSLGKSSRYQLCRRLDGLHDRYGHCKGEENFLPLSEIEPRFLDCLSRSIAQRFSDVFVSSCTTVTIQNMYADH